MSDGPVTLGTLMCNGSSGAGANALVDAMRKHALVSVTTLSTLQWKAIAHAVEDQVSTQLDVSLGAILVRSWCDIQALREAADPRRTPPDTTRSVPLVEHSIESVHHPKLEITIEGVGSFDFSFEVKLELKISGAIVSIRNGRVREIEMGKCHGDVTLSSEGHRLYRVRLGSARFPGHVHFSGDGMPVGEWNARAPMHPPTHRH